MNCAATKYSPPLTTSAAAAVGPSPLTPPQIHNGQPSAVESVLKDLPDKETLLNGPIYVHNGSTYTYE
jgi:hypothetical protein